MTVRHQPVDLPTQTRGHRTRQWINRRFVWAGGLSGAMGGLCCVGAAIAIATGLGGLSFLTTWQERYTPYFVAGSIALMAAWLGRQVAMFGFNRAGLRRAARSIGRQAAVMGVVYSVTLALAFATMGVVEAVA